jgi:hypothetical protein
MNLFYLDRDPVEAARLQCDRHVVKMILETAQMLSTAHYELDGESPAYKPTHKNHPSTVWVRSSSLAYNWAWRHLRALGNEYTKRYGKTHKTISEHLEALRRAPRAMSGCSDAPFTEPPQCMYDECKLDDTVLAYLTYYNAKADEWAAKGSPMKWYGSTAE